VKTLSWRNVAGSTFVSLGILLGTATAFLTYWQFAANGEHDIEARGGILLFLMLPEVLAVSWILVAALIAVPLRRSGLSWWTIGGLSLLASLIAAVLEFLPPLILERALAVLPPTVRPAGDFVCATLFVLAGMAIVRQPNVAPAT
jgi:hypothetical protein